MVDYMVEIRVKSKGHGSQERGEDGIRKKVEGLDEDTRVV